jgi:hypothetical protein
MGTPLSSAGVSWNWGMAACTLAASVGLAMQPPSEPPSPSDGGFEAPNFPSRTQLQLKVERDGVLTVEETITVRRGGSMNRKSPLRIRSGDDRDRVFTIRDARVEGNGSAESTADEFSVRLGEGKSVLRYRVDGAVADLGDHQEVRWQIAAGWDVRMGLLRASFIAPELPVSVSCRSGAFGSTTECKHARTEQNGVTRVDLQDLAAGDRVDLAVGLPAGTVPANARFVAAATENSAFALTPFSGFGLLGLTALLLAGLALLWAARGRDAKALATDVGPVDVLFRDGESAAFASPDGVLPGQVGTVLDERVDPVDVTATVVDLAVRNYIWIEELPSDWRIVRRNPADESLRGYERAVYDTLLPNGVDAVEVSTLVLNMNGIREAMYADVVDRGWFARRPDRERRRWMWIGAGLAVAGAALTAVLALTVGNALLGLALVIAGVALALGARFMPARTKRGSVLVAQVRALVDYLRTTEQSAIPEADRELIFSRSLPYAVVLAETPRWLAAFAGLPGLYWYGGDRRDVGGFVLALDRAVAK